MAENRLSVLLGHFRDQDHTLLATQDCAAHNLVFYGRPEAPKDCLFARPASEDTSTTSSTAVYKTSHSETYGRHTSYRTKKPTDDTSWSPQDRAAPNNNNNTIRNYNDSGTLPLFARVGNDTISSPMIKFSDVLPSSSFSVPLKSSPITHVSTNVDDTRRTSKMIESDFGYSIKVALPGIQPDDVRIELLPGNRLTVTTRASSSNSSSSSSFGGMLPALYSRLPEVFGLPRPRQHGEEESVTTMHHARQLSWILPDDANLNSVQAELKDGLLVIKLSKSNVLTLL